MTTGSHIAPHATRLVIAAVAAVAVAAVLVAAAGTSPAGAQDAAQEASQGPVVEPARQLTTQQNPARLFAHPDIAVHPDDPSTVGVFMGDVRNPECGVRVSQDGGLSWSDFHSVMPNDEPFCIQRNFGPALDLEFAADGTMYMAMSGSSAETEPPHPDGPVSALVARSPDLGQSHETFTLVDSGINDSYQHRDGETYGVVQHRKYNNLAVDPNDAQQVYRAWEKRVRGVDQGPVPGWGLGCPDNCAPLRSKLAISTDGGDSWSEPIDLLNAAGMDDVFGLAVPRMVVGSDGTVYAFAQESRDRGSEEPDRLFMFTSTDGGQSWQGQEILEGVAEYREPEAAINHSNGNLYLTWSQRGDSEENPSSVVFMASTDGGESWTEPTDITDEPAERGVNQYLPGISVAPNGRIDVAWFDYRNDPFFTGGEPGSMGTTVNERFWDVYYTHSTDGGQSWAPNMRVNDRLNDGNVGVTFSNQDIRGPIAVGSTSATAMFAWPDARAGGAQEDVQDVYFSRVRHDGAAATAASDGEAGGLPGWGWALLGAAIGLLIAGLLLVVALRSTRLGRRQAAPA
jgi:hypothetical protein